LIAQAAVRTLLVVLHLPRRDLAPRIDKKYAGLPTVFDRLRRKRNMALYDDTGFVSHHDAEQALDSAGDYLYGIRIDIAARKPSSKTLFEIAFEVIPGD
jgi:hypothetical protein